MNKFYLSTQMNSRNWIQFAVIFFLFFSFGNSSKAQLDTEFWFAPPELTQSTNEGAPRDRPIQLVVSTLEKAAVVTILQPADLTFAPIVLNMPANTTQIVNLTPFIDRMESKPHNTVLKTGLYIKSTNSISVYYEIKSVNNTDIFALKGLNALGKRFYTPFQTHWDNSLGNSPNFPPPANTLYNPTTFASFDIIATDDTTEVTVTPTKDLVGHPAGIPFSFMLNRGQVYSCRAASRFGPDHPAGSKIVSNKDVAVTIKDDMLRFNSDQISPSPQGADLAGDQLIPVDFLGKNYVLVKGGLANNADRCYILATEDNTIVRVDGNPIPLDTLNEGEQYELRMLNQSYFLTSNKNVCVWHISGIADQIGGAIIPSLNCTGTNRIGFTRTNAAQFIVNVITKSTAINNFTLNGDPSLVPGSAFQTILGSNGWMFARITFSTSQIPAGTTLLLQNSGDELFHVGVTNYASGVGSNYGYFSNFSRLNLGSVKNVCQGDTALIDAGPAKTLYQWNTGESTRIIRPLQPGKYWVNTLSGTQCPKTDTVIVNYYNPTFSLGPDDTICIGGSRRIIPDGVFTYKWQDGTTSPTYLATQAGKYYADVKDFQGCPASDTILIAESPRPALPVASLGDTVCKGGLVNLSMAVVPNAKYAWADPDSNIISGRTIVVNTLDQKAGAYKAFVKIAGCESFFDTAFVGVVDGPPVNLGKDTVLCNPGGGLTLDAGNHLPGNTYLWSNSSTDSTLQVSVTGSYFVEVTSSFGCVSNDTIGVIFQNLPNQAVFNGPNTFCANQTASFGVDQEPNFVYEWTGPNGFTFTGNTVNLSNVQTSATGSYTVTPKLNGCAGTATSRTITINNSPIINLGKDSSSCTTFSLNLDPTEFGNGLTYLWSNSTTDSSLSVSQAGTYSVAVSNGTCLSRDTITLTFGAGPSEVNFTGIRNYCANENASFGVVPVSGETYAWSGPNGFSLSGPSINLSEIQIAQAGQYTVTPSLPSCPGPPFSINIIVRPSPIADLGKDTSFCPGIGIVLDPTPNGGEDVFYQWSNLLADSSILVTQPGTYRVTATLGLCSTKDTIIITTAPVPAAVAFTGITEYCPGQNVSFGVNPVSGVNYTWSGPNSFSFNGSDIVINSVQGNQGGDYVVTPFLNGCPGSKDSVLLDLKSAPVLTLEDEANVCNGNSITLDPIVNGNGLTYLWSNNSTDSSIIASTIGIYKVTVSNGVCSSIDSIEIKSGISPAQPVLNGLLTYCSGQNASFGVDSVAGVSYSWSGPNGFTSQNSSINITNIATSQAGAYIVIPNLNGCLGQSASATIVVTASPVIELGPNDTICGGGNVVLDPIGSSQGLTFLWSNSLTDTSITVSSSGKYFVTVSENGCSSLDSINLEFGSQPGTLVISGQNNVCEGQDLILKVQQQAGVFVSWLLPGGDVLDGDSIILGNIQLNQSGDYIASTSQNACPGTGDTISISINPSPQIELGADASICNGNSFSLDPAPHGEGFTYLWSNNSTDSSIVVSVPGKYKVIVSNGSGCSSTDSINVSLGTAPATPVITGISGYCSGNTASFGVAESTNVTFSWTGPNGFTFTGANVSISNISVSNAGQYIVTPSLGGCIGTSDTLTISVGTSPVIELGPNDTICGGGNLVLDPIGFSQGLTFSWSNSSTDTSITVSTSGKYFVTVSNNGCSSVDSIGLTFATPANPLVITGTTFINDTASFCQGNDLTLGVTPQTGISVFWLGPNGFSEFSNSILLDNMQVNQSGAYIASTLANACPGIGDTVYLKISPSPQIELGADASICNGNSFSLDPAPHGEGFTYLWSNNSTDSSIIVSTPGLYKVTVSNGSGCSASDSINVSLGTAPATPVITGTSGYCSGNTASFGVTEAPTTTFTWTGPNGFTFTGANVSIPNILASNAGQYIVTPSLGGCIGTSDTITISVGTSPVIELGPNDTICSGGNVVLDPIGSSQGLTFLWSNSSIDTSLSVSTTGKYIVIVSNNGCSSKDSINLTFAAQANTLVIAGVSSVCQGQSTTLNTTPQTGVSVNWTGPNGFTSNGSSITLTNLQANQAGSYIASTSQNACPGIGDTVLVSIIPSPQIELGADRNLCNGSNTTLDPIPNGAGLTYLWSNNSTDSSIIVSGAGKYIVTVTNGGNCKSKDSVNVFISNSPGAVTFTSITTFCTSNTAIFGVIETPGVTYAWTGPNGFTSTGDTISIPNISSSNAGQYTVTPSLNSCIGTASSITISIAPGPNTSLGADQVICGNTNPVILDPVANGLPGYTYLWNSGNDDSTITVGQTGTYSVAVTYLGCTKSDTINLTFKPLPVPVTIEGNFNHCSGDTVKLSLQGVQNAAIYNWAGPSGFTLQGQTVQLLNANPTQSGTYTVTPDLDGCLGIPTSIPITINLSPVIELGPGANLCAGASYTLIPTSQSQGLTFSWNTGSTDSNLVVNQSGLYAVTVANAAGCFKRDTVIMAFNLIPVDLSFTGDTILCAGETANFGVLSQFEVSNTWTGPSGFTSSGDLISISNVNTSRSGYYVVQPAGLGGCLGRKDSVFLLVSNSPTVSLGEDKNQCGNDPITLKAITNQGNTFLWSTGATADSLNVVGSGTYSVQVKNPGQCLAFDTVVVLIKDKPAPIKIINGSKTVCDQTVVNFEVESQNGVTFSWSGPEPLLSIGTKVGFVAKLQNAGNYVISSMLNGCDGPEANVTLTVKPNPFISVSVDTLVCLGLTKVASANTSTGSSILWSDNSSQSSGNFGVGLHWGQATLNGCSVRDSFQLRNSGPSADFTTPKDSVGTVYELVQFIDKSKAGISPLSSWEWQLGESQVRNVQNPNYTYNLNGEFDIQLIVKDQAGCSDTLKKTLTIEGPKTWNIPSLFTPNGDGDNDTFVIIQLDLYPGTEVKIYNRWGNEEFSSSNYQNDWGGADLVEGVYFYTVKRGVDGQEFRGNVYLRR